MDFSPINKYYNKNAFNYLALFADIYDKYHKIDNNKKKFSKMNQILQIWKIKKKITNRHSFRDKKLKQKTRSKKRGWLKSPDKHKNAVFHYGINHKGGIIWDIKWLPFRIKHKPAIETRIPYQRLGILAVCSDDNIIYIYSLPFSIKDSILIDIEPIIKLSVKNEKFLRISWSSNIIYPMLIASTANGNVSIWDFKLITDKINKDKSNNIKFNGYINDQQLNLIQCYSSNEIITGIDWCSDHLKYFITCSQNGVLRLWDINNLYTPIFTRKLHGLSTDIKWISGLDSCLVTTESYAPNNRDKNFIKDTGNENILKQDRSYKRTSTDCCTKFASIWPQKYLDDAINDNQEIDPDSLTLPTLNRQVSRNYSRMGTIIQFPGEKLFDISDKVAFSIDVLLKCDCNNHGNNIDLTNSLNDTNKLISSNNVDLYIVIGYNSGNVILYKYKLNELTNIKQQSNGQIISQLIYDKNKNKTQCIGPFYGINSDIYQNKCNISRYIWTDNNKHKPIYDPYHLEPTKLALNDNVSIRKVKICPNNEFVDIVSGSISGIIRIQTVQQ